MITKREIVDILGRERIVERIAVRVAGVTELDDNLRDLCQMVYLAILCYDEDKLRGIWDREEITFFVARVLMNQYNSRSSQYYKTYLRFRERSVDLSDIEFKTADND